MKNGFPYCNFKVIMIDKHTKQNIRKRNNNKIDMHLQVILGSGGSILD